MMDLFLEGLVVHNIKRDMEVSSEDDFHQR